MNKKQFVVGFFILLFLFFVPVVQYDYEKMVGMWDGFIPVVRFANGTERDYRAEDFPLCPPIRSIFNGEQYGQFACIERNYNCTIDWEMTGGEIYETWHYSGSVLHFLFGIGYGVTERKE